MLVFNVESPADFDWLEHAIIANGYYEKPGVWVLDVDFDKRLVAEMIAAFAPAAALELGCAAGAVLQCLDAHRDRGRRGRDQLDGDREGRPSASARASTRGICSRSICRSATTCSSASTSSSI